MDLFIYSDESGVFDVKHENFFVFGGLILINSHEKNNLSKEYSALEELLRKESGIKGEIKSSRIKNITKVRLYSVLKKFFKFGVIIEEKRVLKEIFDDKKHRQRYLDYAYKIGLKNALQELMRRRIIKKEDVNNIYVYPDAHSTATDGRYELQEALNLEFKRGTFNAGYNMFFEPIFPCMKGGVTVQFCNSSHTRLVRAADIVSNFIFHLRLSNKDQYHYEQNLFITYLP